MIRPRNQPMLVRRNLRLRTPAMAREVDLWAETDRVDAIADVRRQVDRIERGDIVSGGTGEGWPAWWLA